MPKLQPKTEVISTGREAQAFGLLHFTKPHSAWKGFALFSIPSSNSCSVHPFQMEVFMGEGEVINVFVHFTHKNRLPCGKPRVPSGNIKSKYK
jgi:hypothetical protein